MIVSKTWLLLTSRHKITLLKGALCISTIAGAILVVQPTFIFGEDSGRVFYGRDYMIGIAVAIPCAFTAGLGNVLSAKVTGFNMSLFQIILGMMTMLVALIGPMVNLQNRFVVSVYPTATSGPVVSELTFREEIPLATGAALGSTVGGLLVILACQQAPPVVVSVVRCSELILALIADHLIFPKEDQPVPGALHISGSLLVMISVSLMAASDLIEEKICKKPRPSSHDIPADDDTLNDKPDSESDNFTPLIVATKSQEVV